VIKEIGFVNFDISHLRQLSEDPVLKMKLSFIQSLAGNKILVTLYESANSKEIKSTQFNIF
jgi:hypothetical protein